MKNLIYILLITLIVSCQEKVPDILPILGERSISETDTIYHTIPDFKFVNQDSQYITPKTFEDKIYISDFFFTSCPTICPIMKKEMLRVYEKYKNQEDFLMISHSIDWRNDSVPVLKKYSSKLGVDNSKWHFVTGPKDHIYDMAFKYLVAAAEDEDSPGGYTHSGNIMLVDKEKRLRGYYDGTKTESVNLLIRDIAILSREYMPKEEHSKK